VVRELLGDPAARREQGRAGVRRARQLYDWDRVALQSLDLYEELAARRRSRRFTRSAGPEAHIDQLRAALDANAAELTQAQTWGQRLAGRLGHGGRLLAVGNGGSAAEAQHLTAELVGRFERDRLALSAICLHGDTSSLTAIANDYGVEQAFARQVYAHARSGDVLVALSTSGRSPNVLAAARAARELGLTVWGLTGPAPNPLADLCDDALCFDAERACTVQELHLVAIHVLCGAVDAAMARERPPAAAPAEVIA